jgi:hypothetical protein
MAYIRYTSTRFIKPKPIDELEYINLKKAIDNNAKFEIYDIKVKPVDLSSGNSMGKFILICLLGGISLLFIGGTFIDYLDGTWALPAIMLPGFFGLMTGVMGIFSGALSGISEASALSDMKSYYKRMKKEIKKSKSYSDFYKSFY